jgi:PadR family transcriptional regulator, regulatory protein PadR
MSRKKIEATKKRSARASRGKLERYMQPSILLGLYMKPSYGYELIQGIQRFGFVEGQAPPGMIYRHLRQLEEEGLVTSEWQTEGTGPAKRVYHITPEGKEVLSIWTEYMERQAENLTEFIAQFRQVKRSDT